MELEYEYNGVVYPSRRLALAARREHYVELIAGGMNFTQAARAVGVSKRTGKVWRNGRTRSTGRNEAPSVVIEHSPGIADSNRAGGSGISRKPASSKTGTGTGGGFCYGPLMRDLDAPSGRYLTYDERNLIADLHDKGMSIRAIAAQLGRSASTISRELARGKSPQGIYGPRTAHQMAYDRRLRPKARKTLEPGLWGEVMDKLKLRWSPAQISRYLNENFPHNKHMNACPETIYQAIYIQAKGTLKAEIIRAMRQGRAERRPQEVHRNPRPRFRDPMVMISQRPASIEDRAVPGHWEGDLIIGKNGTSAIGTLVERSTRFLMLVHLPDGHTSEQVVSGIIKQMRQLPEHMRGSLTWDQGAEMARHQHITTALNMDVYFCDPHSPWQRGTNENTNGLLRQYFPKGTDLSVYTPSDLARVADELNERPRQTLGWKTPKEAFNAFIQQTESTAGRCNDH